MSNTPDYVTPGDGFADIALKRGAKIDGTQVKALRMREPKVSDQLATEAAKGSDAEREITLFANLCEQSVDAIKDLSLADYRRLQEAYRLFLD